MNKNFDCFQNSLKLLKVRSFSCDGSEFPNLEVLYFQSGLQIEISKFDLRTVIIFFF